MSSRLLIHLLIVDDSMPILFSFALNGCKTNDPPFHFYRRPSVSATTLWRNENNNNNNNTKGEGDGEMKRGRIDNSPLLILGLL